jgi:hypothetical protein
VQYQTGRRKLWSHRRMLTTELAFDVYDAIGCSKESCGKDNQFTVTQTPKGRSLFIPFPRMRSWA